MLENTSFYSTESSLILSTRPSSEAPFWAEVHVHFGRYNVIRVTAIVTSETVPPKQGIQFLTSLMSSVEHDLLNLHVGFLSKNVELEVYITVFYYGIRICHPPIDWDENQYKQLVNSTADKINRTLLRSKK